MFSAAVLFSPSSSCASAQLATIRCGSSRGSLRPRAGAPAAATGFAALSAASARAARRSAAAARALLAGEQLDSSTSPSRACGGARRPASALAAPVQLAPFGVAPLPGPRGRPARRRRASRDFRGALGLDERPRRRRRRALTHR